MAPPALAYCPSIAWRAGLSAGDSILAIDGVSTRGMPTSQAVARLRGRAGSRVAMNWLADSWLLRDYVLPLLDILLLGFLIYRSYRILVQGYPGCRAMGCRALGNAYLGCRRLVQRRPGRWRGWHSWWRRGSARPIHTSASG